MADEASRPGRLIAVDGSRGSDVMAEAERLAQRLRARDIDCAISRWDASGVFADLLVAEPRDRVVTPRMLTLLYAADLFFRLRWEIQPALSEGRVVIAAPYLHAAIGVGIGLGLPEDWLRNVLRFVPPPDALRLAREEKRAQGWRPRPARGYGEFCTALLKDTPAGLRKRQARRRAMEWLATAAGPLSVRRKVLVDRLGGDERADGLALE